MLLVQRRWWTKAFRSKESFWMEIKKRIWREKDKSKTRKGLWIGEVKGKIKIKKFYQFCFSL